jgi:hypothetical protein
MIVAGLALLALVLPRLHGLNRRRKPARPPQRLVLILLLVELRSGQSVLGALQGTAQQLPEFRGLTRVARLATVSGLPVALDHAPDSLRPVLSQLIRAQRSGASLTTTITRSIEADLADTRAQSLARARSLPARLMIPVTLLMLPGVVLLLYGPALIGLYEDLVGVWS